MYRFIAIALVFVCSSSLLAQELVTPSFVGTSPSTVFADEDFGLVVDTGASDCGNDLVSSSLTVEEGVHVVRFDVVSDESENCDDSLPLRVRESVAGLDVGFYDIRVLGRYDQVDLEPVDDTFRIRTHQLPRVDRIDPETPTQDRPVSALVTVSASACTSQLNSSSVDVVGRDIYVRYDAETRPFTVCGVPPPLSFWASFVPTQGGEHNIVVLGRFDGVDLDPVYFPLGVLGSSALVPINGFTPILLAVILLLFGLRALGGIRRDRL